MASDLEKTVGAGGPVHDSELNGAMRQALRLLAIGKRADPMLRQLLLDGLVNEDRSDRPHDPAALVSDAARAATQWIGVSAEDRAYALCDLLLFTDATGPKPAVSLPGKVTEIHRSLQKAVLPHAFGGALAVAYYGEPRMTKDIDLNIFVSSERWDDVREALKPLGVEVELDRRELGLDTEIRLDWEGNSVHLFFSCDPLHEEMPARARTVPLNGDTIPIVAPEHLVVRKAVLDRTKDRHDIEQILVATSPLDLDEIECWLQRMVGADDPRMEKLREVKAGLSLD